MRSFRHYFPKEITAPDQSAPVLLVGAGGTGSHILSGLARMNFALRELGHPGLEVHTFDPDPVSEANIGRQLFSRSDIGRNKAEVLTTRVNLLFGTNWYARPERFGKKSTLESNRYPAIVITATDNVKSRKLIYRINCTYWLDCGNTLNTGQTILGTLRDAVVKQPCRNTTVSRLPTVLDLYDIEKDSRQSFQGPSCSVPDALQKQDLFVNHWTAATAIQILWSGFRQGFVETHGAFINLKSLSIRPLQVSPDVWLRMGYAYKQ